MEKFKTIKKEIRILAFDDGPFKSKTIGKDILIGVIFRGGQFIDGLLKADIDIDGMDAQIKIIDLVKKTRHKDIRIIMLDGITFAGFNIVNIKEIYENTRLPVIVINRKMPNFDKFKRSIAKFSEANKRLKCVDDAGPVHKVNVLGKNLYFQCCGLEIKEAEKIIKISSTKSVMPEPLRVAHIIAGGVVLGESSGRA